MHLLVVAALASGLALGCATVSLAALLPSWCGLPAVGVGTGLGYAVCNIPAVFQSSPAHQACISAAIAVIGAVAVPSSQAIRPVMTQRSLPLISALLLFTALVWMDSAAFFIIQHADDLKSATWGEAHLWRNAALHLLAAIASGFILTKSPKLAPLLGWLLLAIAGYSVNSPSSRESAGWLYPPAVSMYSVALVAWPGWFSGTSGSRATAWKAAWLFAIAGWFGSTNGIGMVQSLHRVPTAFLAVAAFVVVLSLALSDLRHWRKALVIGIIAIIGSTSMLPPSKQPTTTAAERGRLVYISEGCIHCHTRYPRPGSADETLWGPAADHESVLKQQPVLIGNRRQGPDLANVGARRSEAWLKAHFLNPRALSPDSTMPVYAHLFEDTRGDDLVRYLRESGIQNIHALMKQQQEWKPKESTSTRDATSLFARHCAACHGENANGHGTIASQLHVQPTNLHHGPFVRTSSTEDIRLQIARIIKFGVIGSDMPGHETMRDDEIMVLADMLADWRKR
jgi:cytochrome c oxidase cbb3-type subunit 2